MYANKMWTLTCGSLALASLVACNSGGSGDGDGGADGSGMSADDGTMLPTTSGDGDGDGDETGDAGMTSGDSMMKLDNPIDETTGDVGCGEAGGPCSEIDLLFVIDNSGTMAAEQQNLANNFTNLINQLNDLTDEKGNPVTADVHIMVTTTDMDHSLCTDFHPQGYTPAKGAPVTTPCLDRISDFQTQTENATGACTSVCEQAVTLGNGDQFIKWAGASTNVNAGGLTGPDAAAAALECLGPQGINGCGYESPLEAMVQALSPSAEWNSGTDPFLRKNSVLAIALITDEADCSTSPEGQAYFYDATKDGYWPADPSAGGDKTRATSATCWYAGVDCGMPDGNGVYQDCVADNSAGVLHSTQDRYIKFLKEQLGREEVIMLGVVGIPEVTERNDVYPFEPIAGGVKDLVYRDWQASDIVLPGDTDSVDDKTFDFGIGPGCTNTATGQAIPPVRVKEVCQSLDDDSDPMDVKIRCCMESICDDDYSPAIKCLTGVVQSIIVPG